MQRDVSAYLSGEDNYEAIQAGECQLGRDASVGARQAYLAALQAGGWEQRQRLDEVIELTAVSGVRVENYRGIYAVRQEAPGSRNRTDAAMEWRQASGSLLAYPPYWEGTTLEERLRLVIHEGAHATFPGVRANASYYGGEAGRQDAVAYVVAVAEQSLITGCYLNPYHASIGQAWNDGRIDYETFADETWAILLELSMVPAGRVQLADTERRQRVALVALQAQYPEAVYPTPVPVTIGLMGEEKSGMAQHLLHGALYGVHDMRTLNEHLRKIEAVLNVPAWPAEIRRADAAARIASLGAVLRVNFALRRSDF